MEPPFPYVAEELPTFEITCQKCRLKIRATSRTWPDLENCPQCGHHIKSENFELLKDGRRFSVSEVSVMMESQGKTLQCLSFK